MITIYNPTFPHSLYSKINLFKNAKFSNHYN